MTVEVDTKLNDILTNLADSYPQAPASGGTQRMREAITELNRVQDEENDLIYASGLEIREQGGDYTKFVMEVINAALRVTQSSQEDHKDRTVK